MMNATGEEERQEEELNAFIHKEMTYEQLDEIENINIALKNQLEKTKLMRDALRIYIDNIPVN